MTIRRAQLFALLPVTLLVAGCGQTLPAPELPERVMPLLDSATDEALETTPAEHSGRLIVDTVGEPAKVSRVTEVVDTTVVTTPPPATGFAPATQITREKRTELLCVTPCVVDLGLGAHTLMFTSLADRTRTSTTDVVVSSRPSVVRHAIGREKPMSMDYIGGLALVMLGGPLTSCGGIVGGVGLSGYASHVDTRTGQRVDDTSSTLTAGGMMLAFGVLSLVPGILLMKHAQPIEQPGSTLEFTAP